MWNSRRVPARREQIAYKAGTEGTWCVRRQARRRKGGGSVEARKASERAKMIGTRGKQEGVGVG